jgi:hypothetical protein
MIEFPVLVVRPELDLHARTGGVRGWFTPEVEREMREHIRSQLDGQDLIISAEGLSFIRYAEEVEKLRELLDPYDVDFIVVQRERDDFLRSYTQWMRQSNIEPSDDTESCRFLGPDSWILDFDRFPELFPGIKIIDYRKAMSVGGSIIPAIMEGLCADPSTLPGWSDYKLNSALPARQLALRNLKRRVKRRLRR